MEAVRAMVKRALDLGEFVLACEIAHESLADFPKDLLLRQREVIGLAQMGSTRSAQKLLDEMITEGVADSETLSLLGRTWKDDWLARRDPEILKRSREVYERAYALPSTDPAYPGINVATLALLAGDSVTAQRVAEEVRSYCTKVAASGPPDYWNQATLAEALAVLGRIDEAAQAYGEAARIGKGNLRELSSTRRQARLVAHALLGDAKRFDPCFPEVKLVVFSGHMFDEPGRPQPRFPAERAAEVKKAIREHLDEMGALIGFSSAARGADLLFLEAMQERGAAVHVVLPWDRAEFVQTSVRPRDGDDQWVARFEQLLDDAASVQTLGEAYMPDSGIGFDYCNAVMNGRANLSARWLDMEVVPLAFWDGKPGLSGGTGSFVDSWCRAGIPVHVIPANGGLAVVVQNTETAVKKVTELPPSAAPEQEIRAVLFADIVGYGKLRERSILAFHECYLNGIARLVKESPDAPMHINTWGDAFHFIFASVEHAGRFALALRDFAMSVDCHALGLLWTDSNGVVQPLSIRIALHAGPVHKVFDPLNRREIYTGVHVTRTARIEPVTKAGRVFVSEEFAALAAGEGVRDFACELIGTMPLAKDYGLARLYDLRAVQA